MNLVSNDEYAALKSLLISKLEEGFEHYETKLKLRSVMWAAIFFSRKKYVLLMNLILLTVFVLAIVYSAWLIFFAIFFIASIVYFIACLYKFRLNKSVMGAISHAGIHTGAEINFDTAKYFLIRSKKYPKWLK